MKLSGKRTAIGHNSGKHVMHRRSNSITIEESLRLMTEIEAMLLSLFVSIRESAAIHEDYLQTNLSANNSIEE